jgi:hypothetical protein
MSGSDRGKRFEALTIAGFCVVAIFGLIALIYTVGLLNGEQTERRQNYPHAHAETAKQKAKRACIGADPNAVFECVIDYVEASEETANTEQDLTAQQRAAWGALIAAFAGLASVVASILGLYWIKGTLDATRDAANQATIATTAMLQQNEIAREVGQGQVRAYVHIEHATVKFYGNLLAVEMTFNNTGQSPAQKIEVELSPCVWIWAKEGAAIKESPVSCELDTELQYCGVLGASSRVNKSVICVTRGKFDELFFKLSEPERRREVGPTALVHFVLRWWDVFDSKQETFGSISAHRFKWGKVFDHEGLISTDAEPRHVGSRDEWLEQARKATEGRANHKPPPVTDT